MIEQEVSEKSNSASAGLMERYLNHLNRLKNNHSIWKNPLLLACEKDNLKLEDFQYFFSQYYFYSKNFTRLLAACMVHCNNDFYRSKLSQNLWEEGGGLEIEQRHAELFRQFLIKSLGLDIKKLEFEGYSKYFFSQYLELCLNDTLTASAVLSFGTEGIVARLYKILKSGLLKCGMIESDLTFFNIHIECDDDHAVTLQELCLSFKNEKNWLEQAENAMISALDLRDNFFSEIYQGLQRRKFEKLISRIGKKSDEGINLNQTLKYHTERVQNTLYNNTDKDKKICFQVERVPFEAEILDPRVVNIPSGFTNELHNHAHETVFLILKGVGEVIVNDSIIPVEAGDMVYVPRWARHQTKNTGDSELKFFAVTDYGFTKNIPENSESIYRLKK